MDEQRRSDAVNLLPPSTVVAVLSLYATDLGAVGSALTAAGTWLAFMAAGLGGLAAMRRWRARSA